jgi:hypothetical protein
MYTEAAVNIYMISYSIFQVPVPVPLIALKLLYVTLSSKHKWDNNIKMRLNGYDNGFIWPGNQVNTARKCRFSKKAGSFLIC